MCYRSQPIISTAYAWPRPLDSLPIPFAAEALISGIASKSDCLIAGTKIDIYGSRSLGSYVKLQIFPISVDESCFAWLSCIVSPASSNGTNKLKLGASIAWAKLVFRIRLSASTKWLFVFESALTITSSKSPISGHLITEPIFLIASIAASCTFSCVSFKTSRSTLTI